MRIFKTILLGIIFSTMLFAASCNFGTIDDDQLPIMHNEGGGGDV